MKTKKMAHHAPVITKDMVDRIYPMNIELKDGFIEYLSAMQRSESTITGYSLDIDFVFVWNLIYNGNKFFCDWGKQEMIGIQNWMSYMNDDVPARISRVRSALSSFCNYIINVRCDEFPCFENFVKTVDSPRVTPLRRRSWFHNHELVRLLKYLTSNEYYEQACFVALAMFSGRNKTELCKLRVSDFNKKKLICNGVFYKSEKICTGYGGAKFIYCYTLAKKFQPYFDMWMEHRKRSGIKSEWLFPTKSDESKHIKSSWVDGWSSLFSNVIGQRFYIYQLDQYYRSRLTMLGVPEEMIDVLTLKDACTDDYTYDGRSFDRALCLAVKRGKKRIRKQPTTPITSDV